MASTSVLRTSARRGALLHRGRDAVVIYTLVLAAVAIGLLPYFWMVSSSLKTMANMFSVPIQWIPDPVNWQSYVIAWHAQDFTRYFLNSGVVAVAITLGNLVFASLAGYSLAKFRYFGRGLLFILILSTMMLPLEVTMVPLFLIIKQLDWANSYQGLIVPFLVDGFGVFLMRQFFSSVPDDLIAAARLDGLNEAQIWWEVALPLVTPALSALAIFVFLGNWTAFLWPLIVTSSKDLYTVPVGLAAFSGEQQTQWEMVMTGASVATAPVLAVFLLLQKYIIDGIMLTGLKG